MQKSPEKPLRREHEPYNCWGCDKKYTLHGQGCGRIELRILKRRGQRRFEKEITDMFNERVYDDDDYDDYCRTDEDIENWLLYKFGPEWDDDWLDED